MCDFSMIQDAMFLNCCLMAEGFIGIQGPFLQAWHDSAADARLEDQLASLMDIVDLTEPHFVRQGPSLVGHQPKRMCNMQLHLHPVMCRPPYPRLHQTQSAERAGGP